MQNTACSININGRAVECGAPPGHTRELVGSRCLFVGCKHQHDGSLRQGECSGLRDIQKKTGLRGETSPTRGIAEQGKQHRPREEIDACSWDTQKHRIRVEKPPKITTGGEAEQGKQHGPGKEMEKGEEIAACLWDA